MEPLIEIGRSLVTVVIFIVLLGALVVIHELGHFLTARLAGIRVHEFGIGFPPRARVLGRGSETTYTLNWLPLGGFVKLEGEDGDSDDPRSFTRARLPVKVVVLVAGVLMNLILSFAIFAALAWWPQPAYGFAFESVQPDSPASRAGLTAADRIVEIDGRRFDQLEAQPFFQTLGGSAGKTVTLGVIRGGSGTSVEPLTVTLRTKAEIDETHGALGIVKISWVPTELPVSRTPGEALGLGWTRTVDAFTMIASGLGGVFASMLLAPTTAPAASGPVGIAVAVGEVFWQAGIGATLYLAAILSANLALVNILPFPPLDGGRVLMVVLRALVGSRLSVRVERLTYLVGFAFLFAFIIWITVFDLARLGGAVQ